MTGTKHRHPVPDRARRRAVRALAAQLGVPYSVAARMLAEGRRPVVFAQREQRPFHARVRDTREAVDLPLGRAAHLSTRFQTGEPGLRTVLAMLYATVEHEAPALKPAPEELSWVADLGEEAAVDITCGALDQAARLLLDDDTWHLWNRIEAALTAGDHNADPRIRDASRLLGRELRTVSLRGALPAARRTLDRLLTV